MKYYRSRRKLNITNKKKLFRVIFTIAAAIIILAVTLMIGNNLKSKIDSLDKTTNGTHASAGLTAERRVDESSIYEGYSPTVFSVRIDLGSFESDSSLKEAVSAEIEKISQIYDTVTLVLTDSDGDLLYASEAMHEITRVPIDTENATEEIINEIISEAKDAGLRTCAQITSMIPELTISGAATIDSRLISELADMGFDEVLLDFSDYVTEAVTYEQASRIRTYLMECSSLSNESCHIGIILPAEVYMNAAAAKQIQLMASSSSFIAIRFDLEGEYYTTEVFDKISDIVVSLLGNFSVYNMRVMISSPYDLISAAAYNACAEHGIKNVAFGSYISPDLLDNIDIPEVDEEDEENEEEAEITSNPYATTTDNPSIGANDRNDSDDVIEEETTEESDGTSRPWF